MAKYTKYLTGSFDEVLDRIHKGILDGSVSASYEDGSDCRFDDVRSAVRVYERYSAFGGNRVSLNVTLTGKENNLFLTAITSGGSQAMLFKMNTFGEEAFLECLIDVVEGESNP